MGESGEPLPPLRATVALLRGINVGGNRIIPMAELRALAERVGLASVSTYIQSGNLLFRTALTPEEVAVVLEEGIKKRFGFDVPVIVRTHAQWEAYAEKPPFPDAVPKMLHLCLPRRPPAADCEAKLCALAKGGERVKVIGDAIWIDFAENVAKSKLSPVAMDKIVGSTVTARNAKSVATIAELLRALETAQVIGRAASHART